MGFPFHSSHRLKKTRTYRKTWKSLPGRRLRGPWKQLTLIQGTGFALRISITCGAPGEEIRWKKWIAIDWTTGMGDPSQPVGGRSTLRMICSRWKTADEMIYAHGNGFRRGQETGTTIKWKVACRWPIQRRCETDGQRPATPDAGRPSTEVGGPFPQFRWRRAAEKAAVPGPTKGPTTAPNNNNSQSAEPLCVTEIQPSRPMARVCPPLDDTPIQLHEMKRKEGGR